MNSPNPFSLQSSLHIVCSISAVILLAYTAYVTKFSVKKSAFRNRSIFLHNAPGLVISILGTAGWMFLEYQLSLSTTGRVDALQRPWFWVSFYLWLACFLGNTTTGFFMIPLLPNVDPAVKREFISLVLCQISFVPVILGLVNKELVPQMTNFCFGISAVGLVVSVTNFTLYLMDFMEGRSQTVCSGSYLVSEMEKQLEQKKRSKKSTAFHDYVAICFQRGSEKTRMPANSVMLFIALTLVVPFPLIAAIALQFDTIHAVYPPETMNATGLMTLLVLGTVGNMQVFHGTLAVRGKETVSRASILVAATVVVEVVLVFATYMHVMGATGFGKFLYCIATAQCPPTYARME